MLSNKIINVEGRDVNQCRYLLIKANFRDVIPYIRLLRNL